MLLWNWNELLERLINAILNLVFIIKFGFYSGLVIIAFGFLIIFREIYYQIKEFSKKRGAGKNVS